MTKITLLGPGLDRRSQLWADRRDFEDTNPIIVSRIMTMLAANRVGYMRRDIDCFEVKKILLVFRRVSLHPALGAEPEYQSLRDDRAQMLARDESSIPKSRSRGILNYVIGRTALSPNSGKCSKFEAKPSWIDHWK